MQYKTTAAITEASGSVIRTQCAKLYSIDTYLSDVSWKHGTRILSRNHITAICMRLLMRITAVNQKILLIC